MSEEIMWLDSRPTAVVKTGADVRVSRCGKTNQIMFTFYNDADRKITHNGTMILGLGSDGYYFKEGIPNVQGNKVTVGKRSCSVKFTIRQPLGEEFFGQFRLTLHPNHNLWRINITNRIGE